MHQDNPLEFLKTFLHQAELTRRHLSTMKLEAQGWQAHKVNPEHLVGPQTMLYVWDLPTAWVWMCSVPTETFDRISEDSHAQPTPLQESIRGALAYMVSRAAEPQAQLAQHNPDWEEHLAALLCAYLGTTRTWELVKPKGTVGHFIVLNYRPSARHRDGNFRPFFLGSPTTASLPAQQLKALIEEVSTEDKRRHPEWFR